MWSRISSCSIAGLKRTIKNECFRLESLCSYVSFFFFFLVFFPWDGSSPIIHKDCWYRDSHFPVPLCLYFIFGLRERESSLGANGGFCFAWTQIGLTAMDNDHLGCYNISKVKRTGGPTQEQQLCIEMPTQSWISAYPTVATYARLALIYLF